MEIDDEKPMNEEQWERFMQESEAKSARFGDLLETLHDHPDRDAIIAREMGWDREDEDDQSPFDDEDLAFAGDSDDESAEADFTNDESADADDAESGAGDLEFDDDGDDDGDDPFDPEGRSKDHIPAYKLAFDVGLEVHQALKPFMEKLDESDLSDRAERLQSAYINSLIPAAKIAGGHGMGEEDDAICGQIVCLKKALAASETAQDDLKWLAANDGLPAELVSVHEPKLAEVSQAIRNRIAELRKKVWWD
jgi:hypothetical protein